MTQNTVLRQAQQALQAGQKNQAAALLKEGLRQNPRDPHLWLMLARLAPTPAARQQCIERAAAIAPHDSVVQKAQQWLRNQQNAAAPPPTPVVKPQPRPKPIDHDDDDTLRRLRQRSQKQSKPTPIVVESKATRPWWLWVGVAAVVLLAAVALTGLLLQGRRATQTPRVTSSQQTTDELAVVDPHSIIAAVIPEEPAVVEVAPETTIAAPTFTPAPTQNPIQAKEVAAKNNNQAEPRATWTLTPTPTDTPTPSPTPIPTKLFESGEVVMPLVGANERWIDVNLSSQTLRAFEGQDLVFETLISSGLPQYATVTGQFRIYYRLESQTMDGRRLGFDYVTENVPYVQYFYGDYALHGAWWHNNFGQQMSHGCVNLSVADSKWLYDWASYNTLVNVHY